MALVKRLKNVTIISFMMMNCVDETVSQTKNPFSDVPLFFISDPPHLMKKLRNNIYNSGSKAISPRYTRYLLLNSKPILWEHIYSVYQRDKNRHLFATDMRSSHVHLDSVGKMKVKLAVQVLNGKVQRDMQAFDPVTTESTQLFIHHCDLLWNVLNNNKPLSTITDSRIQDLDMVLQFLIIGEMIFTSCAKLNLRSHHTLFPGKQCLI